MSEVNSTPLNAIKAVMPLAYTRPMFGGIGVFSENKIMFALIHNGNLYVKSTSESEKEYIRQNYERYSYDKKKGTNKTKYFSLPKEVYENNCHLKKTIIDIVNSVSMEKSDIKPKLRNLPNLKISTERLLSKVSVYDVETLKQYGAVKTYLLLKRQFETITIDMLWSLDGAINGYHSSLITDERKEQLLKKSNGPNVNSYSMVA